MNAPASNGKSHADIREWKLMTGPEIDAVDRSRAVVVVTCSPLEVHGPHLPVVTDYHEAECLAQAAMEGLAELHPEIIFLRLPSIYVAADVLPHVGSVAFRSSTIVAVLEDLGRSLAKQGFRDIWVASFHGGPRHFVPIEVACDRVNRRHGARMVSLFSLLIGRITGGETDLSAVFADIDGMSRESLEGDSHGGAVETSLMLHMLGEHVRDCFRELPRRTVDLRLRELGRPSLGHPGPRPSLQRIFRGLKEKLKFYEQETYSGDPSIASAAAGEEMLRRLTARSVEALSLVWRREIHPSECHSPLWGARWIFTSGLVSRVFERAVGYRNRIF